MNTHLILVKPAETAPVIADLSPSVLTPEKLEKLEALCRVVRKLKALGYTVLSQIMPLDQVAKPEVMCTGKSFDALIKQGVRPVWIDNRRHAELDGVWIVWEQAQ